VPKLGQEKLVTLTLPSSTKDDPATVTVDTEITGGDALLLEAADDRSEAAIELVAHLIKEWNFTDGEGKAADISAENVKKLSIGDFKYLTEQIFSLLGLEANASPVSTDEKKD
jgi:hypothetical protein